MAKKPKSQREQLEANKVRLDEVRAFLEQGAG